MAEPKTLRCDSLGCDETHPIDHEYLGRPSFGTGRCLGWVYLDLNRPDLLDRPLRFCSARCCLWWLENQTMLRKSQELTPLDRAIRHPDDEMARRRAGLKGTG